MFHRLKQSLEALAALVDDILDADPASSPEAEPAVPAHPHDRAVSVRIPRRAGSVAPRELHCLCPVCPTPARRPAKIPG